MRFAYKNVRETIEISITKKFFDANPIRMVETFLWRNGSCKIALSRKREHFHDGNITTYTVGSSSTDARYGWKLFIFLCKVGIEVPVIAST